MRTVTGVLVLVATIGLSGPGQVSAQPYPARQVRMILPYLAGTASDTVTRAISIKLGEALGQPVVVDNRPGAAGILGAEAAVQAAPDGYTLLMAGVGPLTINPALYRKLPYDPVRDFTPVVEAAYLPLVLVVHPSLPTRTPQEFVAFARQRPGQLDFGSTGKGSEVHMVTELFKAATGTNMTHIPYKGAPTAMADLISGRIPVFFPSLVSAMPHALAGRLRVLAISTDKRSRAMASVPTFAESGYPSVVAAVWFAIVARAGTPEPIVTKLNAEINRILQMPEIQQRLADQGGEVIGGTPLQLAERIRLDTAKWSGVVKSAGLKPE